MDKDETTKIFAFAGMILIVISALIGVWVSVENRSIADDGFYGEDAANAENRTAFFYTINQESGLLNLDNSYRVNPIPGYSGFNFYLLMMGITLITYAFYSARSNGMEKWDNIAMAGLVIMVVSLIIGAWMGYTGYRIVREINDSEGDFEEIADLQGSILIIRPINAMLVFLGPALMLFSLVMQRENELEPMQKNLATIGIILLIVALILAAVMGIYNKKIHDESVKEETNSDDTTDWFKTKAFISHIFPYLPYLTVGFLLYAFTLNYDKRKFTETKPARLVNIGLVCLLIGFLLIFLPAIKYQQFANEAGGDGDLFEVLEKMGDYADSTGFCNWATSIMFIGIGAMMFSIVYGHMDGSERTRDAKKKNLIFFAILVVGVILGFILGIWKYMGDDVNVNFFLFEYLYSVLLFSSIGLMMFNWTQNPELFRDVKYLCPDCREEVKYVPYYSAYLCETCNELIDEPIEKRIKSCPDCEEDMDFVQQYDRWFCSYCQEYKMGEQQHRRRGGSRRKTRGKSRGKGGRGRKRPAKGRRTGSGRPARSGGSVAAAAGSRSGGRRVPKCRECGEHMTHVEMYDRWFCHTCRRYGGTPGAAGTRTGSATKTRKGKERTRPSGSQWEIFTCSNCGKKGEIKTHKRPLNINCSQCGKQSMLR